ncbi:MAG: hypothetical protein QOE75_938 [Solirubrobacterales bacterium]|jgi:AcrR family transcriptional regulator|nr:hypothetical protein [Solirubrobacterales bacterium]
MGRRTGRPRAGQEVLTRERILDTALRVVDADGLGALTMRRLADELGVDPMAIYRHLPGKQALVAALVGRAFSDLRLPAAAGRPWQDRVRAFAAAYRALARAHPNLVLQIVTDAAAASAAALEASEELYAALEAAGLPPSSIVRANNLIVDYLNGFALAEASAADTKTVDLEEQLADPDERSETAAPTMRRVLAQVPCTDLDSSFAFGLDTILLGLEAIATRERNLQRDEAPNA